MAQSAKEYPVSEDKLADLAQLKTILASRKWSDDTDNYHDYIEAVKAERDLFMRAMMLGIQGVDLYYTFHIERFLEEADAVLQIAKERMQETHQYRERDLKRLLRHPINQFEERCRQHDWTYEYSDAIETYRKGAAEQQALRDLAKANGPDWMKIMEEYYLAHLNRNIDWNARQFNQAETAVEKSR